MSYTITLNHIRYGKQRFDLVELKRRLEAKLADGGAPKLGQLLIHTERLLALMEIADTGRNSKDLQSRINAEFAFLLLDFEHVDEIMSGARAPRRRPTHNQRALPAPKKKKAR